VDDGVQGAISPVPRGEFGVQPEWVPSEPEVADVPFGGVLHEDLEDDRMEMEVQVAVDVIEWETSGAEFLELGAYLRFQLCPQFARREVTKADADRVVAESPLGINETGDFFVRQRGVAAEERQVQADAKLGIFPPERHCLLEGRFVDHDARGGKDAFPVRTDDCLIDAVRAAKIVGIDDQAAAAITRVSHTSISLRTRQ